MARYIYFTLLFHTLLFAQVVHAARITGIVSDTEGKPIPFATVAIPALHRGCATDNLGGYTLESVPTGDYALQFSSVNYSTRVVTVSLDKSEIVLNVTLESQTLDIGSITVTATSQATDTRNSPQSVSVLSERNIASLRGETIGAAIASQSGISTFSTGSSVEKPVVRGLTAQRVLVVSDGIRQEGQQWGDEHGTEIDPFGVESIEIVRGPGSVLFGSDALGGVINVRSKEVPRLDEGAPHLAARMSADLFSGNDQAAGDVELMGASGRFGFRTSLSGRNSGDTRTPSGMLFNSGEEQTNFGGAIAYHHEKLSFDVDYLHFDQLLEIHEDPSEDPSATPRQDITHDRIHAHLLLPTKSFRFEIHSGWQKNHRRELESANATEPVLHLDLSTFTSDLKAHHSPIGDFSGTIGLSLVSQQNRSRASEKLIPEFENTAIGAFLFEQYARDKFVLSLGARVDNHTLDIQETIGEEEFFVESQQRDYSSFSGSFGAVYHLSDAVSLAGNVGRAWRAPTAFELFIDGVHEGTSRYEIGARDLDPERSVSLDGSIRYHSRSLTGTLNFFHNMIDEFIYINPTGDTDVESGFDVYEYRQANATLSGGEIAIQYAVSPHWIVGAAYDRVRGTNDKLNQPLPLIPADRVIGSIRWSARSLSQSILNPFAEFEVVGVMKQDRVATFEEPSKGRVTLNVSGGAEFPFGQEHLLIDVGVKNLTDQRYRDHLSRYRAYADNPGISAYLKLSIPITLVE